MIDEICYRRVANNQAKISLKAKEAYYKRRKDFIVYKMLRS